MLPHQNILYKEGYQGGQINNKESRRTFESAYVFTPAKSYQNNNGIPLSIITADNKPYESPEN